MGKVYRLDVYRFGRPQDASSMFGSVHETKQDAIDYARFEGYETQGESGAASYTVSEADTLDVATALLGGKCHVSATHPAVVAAAKMIESGEHV